jgi:hypothetical protein
MEFYQHVATNGIANLQSSRIIGSEAIALPSSSEERCRLLSVLNDLTSSTYLQQIANLRATRDLLLPRLISGGVDVSELDTEVAENSVEVVAE